MHPRTRTGRSAFRLGLVLAILVTAAVSLIASTATSASQQSKQAAFRHQLTVYVTKLQQVAVRYQRTPQGRAAFAQLGYQPASSLPRARAAVQRMSPGELAVLHRALATYPAWKTMPARLGRLVDRLPATPRRSGLITPDDCATARAAGITQTDVEIAADFAIAADAILEAVPQDLLSEVVRIAAVLIWAVPQATLRGFEHLYNIASACDDADHQALVQSNLDVKVSTRATQASVDSLTTIFNALNALVTSRLDVAVSTRASQTSLTAFNNEFTANATVVNIKLDAANQKLDALTITVGEQGALDLRLKIEEDLSQPGAHPIALFEVPTSAGGYLGLTRDIVADTIATMQATGQGVGNAESFLAAGDAAAAAHRYKDAYTNYGKAYRAAAS